MFHCTNRAFSPFFILFYFLVLIFWTTSNLLGITKENPNHRRHLNISDCFSTFCPLLLIVIVLLKREKLKREGERERDKKTNWYFWIRYEYAMINGMSTLLRTHRDPFKIECPCWVSFKHTFDVWDVDIIITAKSLWNFHMDRFY